MQNWNKIKQDTYEIYYSIIILGGSSGGLGSSMVPGSAPDFMCLYCKYSTTSALPLGSGRVFLGYPGFH